MSRGIVATLAAVLLLALGMLPAAAQTQEYLDEVGLLADQVSQLSDIAVTVNEAWESGQSSFDQTLTELRTIEDATSGIGLSLVSLVPPTEFEEEHAGLVIEVTRMGAAAGGMIEGLRSNDDGTERVEALNEYTDAAADFQTIVDGMLSPGDGTTTTTGGDDSTTTQPDDGSNTSTTAVSTTGGDGETTSTTATAQAAGDESGGGTSIVTIIIVLIVGMLIGLVGGLLIGAQARRDLMKDVRQARGDMPTSPTSPPSRQT